MEKLEEDAIVAMKEGDFKKAIGLYDSILDQGKVPVWIVLSQADALQRCECYQDAFDCLAQIVKLKGGLGNPFFHLLAGLIKYKSIGEFGSGPGAPSDEFARAVIGGGIEMLDGESEEIINKIKKILQPPVGCASWDDTRGTGGATSEELTSSTGWCRHVLTQKGVVIPK